MLRPIPKTLRVGAFLLLASLSSLLRAQTPRVTLDTSEAIFSVVTAMNACGYDQELGASPPLRQQVRVQVTQAVEAGADARAALESMCSFYRDHRQNNNSEDLSEYLSLALQLGDPPGFDLSVPEADLSPDAGYVQGFLPLLRHFYTVAGLHQIWAGHKAEYDAFTAQYHDPVAKMLLATDLYLKLPISTYNGRRFKVLLEPMAAPSQVNARNYTLEYSVVLAPEHGTLRTDAIRHLYLHSILDPISGSHEIAMGRLRPLLEKVQAAPMDDSFKRNMALLSTESLIRAIEARTGVEGKGKAADAQRAERIQKAAEEGFVLAPYFGQQLAAFEQTGTSLTVAYPNWLHDLDVGHEEKRASAIVFATDTSANNLHAGRISSPPKLADQAEARLAAGDIKGAQLLAQEALDEKAPDAPHALFVLARVSTLNRDMEGARSYFERTLAVAKEPHLLAWSHIYLGRIFDLKEEREQAVAQYQAALAAGDNDPAARAAAEKGVQQAYEPPASRNKTDAQ